MLRENLLDELIAAKPVPVACAGIYAPSSAAWVLALDLTVDDHILRAAGLERIDLGSGALGAEDRDAIRDRWPEVRDALMIVGLPERAALAAEVDGVIAVAKVAAMTRRAQEASPSRSPQAAQRLRFEDISLTVAIDGGKPIQVENAKAYRIFKTIAEASPKVINRVDIKLAVEGTQGDRTIPGLIRQLPEPLKDAVKRDNTGYWLCLPTVGGADVQVPARTSKARTKKKSNKRHT